MFLTRNRSPVSWIDAYGIDPIHAKKEAGNITAYLIVTQLVLGLACKRGLHFPGPDVYEEGKHDQGDVLIWAGLYTVFYALLPAVWLHRSSAFSWSKLLSSLKWRENLSIIFVYWAIDFFGVLSDSDFLGLSPSQYALAIPAGIFANTLGAGLPVILIMHVLLITRLAVLCPKKEYKDKLTVQANRLTTIALGGVSYAIFSLFDPGTDYNSASGAFMSVSYIFMTLILIGMCKASFTVTTGNPIIHFICLHVISARVPLDTRMYGEIFGIVQ
ncbi:hypothetical protein TL16_g10777 [Triparma laevis f. inornata]|uniref:Uncharacterized protein n=1 Tax=Triparma laevis f. inornata TaxID=1714386 RepID=A0A9W7BB59_9STRA|nr:hypothetical protein TL16_g10777 [Triparma laevis f. inornata]